jgi:hypothetical protein
MVPVTESGVTPDFIFDGSSHIVGTDALGNDIYYRFDDGYAYWEHTNASGDVTYHFRLDYDPARARGKWEAMIDDSADPIDGVWTNAWLLSDSDIGEINLAFIYDGASHQDLIGDFDFSYDPSTRALTWTDGLSTYTYDADAASPMWLLNGTSFASVDSPVFLYDGAWHEVAIDGFTNDYRWDGTHSYWRSDITGEFRYDGNSGQWAYYDAMSDSYVDMGAAGVPMDFLYDGAAHQAGLDPDGNAVTFLYDDRYGHWEYTDATADITHRFRADYDATRHAGLWEGWA